MLSAHLSALSVFDVPDPPRYGRVSVISPAKVVFEFISTTDGLVHDDLTLQNSFNYDDVCTETRREDVRQHEATALTKSFWNFWDRLRRLHLFIFPFSGPRRGGD